MSLLNQPSYGVSAAQSKEIMRLVKELLDKGLIQPRSSLYCLPMLLVWKKDGFGRICIDYMAPSKNTIQE